MMAADMSWLSKVAEDAAMFLGRQREGRDHGKKGQGTSMSKPTDPKETKMKKFIIGATAALIATVSMAASAEAGWKWKHGHHHGIKIYSPGYNDYCFVKKIKKYDDWGNVYIKKVRVCGY
jgi:hypothetical protein